MQICNPTAKLHKFLSFQNIHSKINHKKPQQYEKLESVLQIWHDERLRMVLI